MVFLGANLWLLLLLYWSENLIVGCFNLLMILTSTGRSPLGRLPFAAFFSVHYGGFVFAHLFVLLTFIGGEMDFNGYFIDNLGVIGLNLVMMSLSYLWEFTSRWWPKRNVLPEMLMSAPYGRIVVLQLTIILGAFATILLGGSLGFIAVLVIIRTLLDVYIYRREREPLEIDDS